MHWPTSPKDTYLEQKIILLPSPFTLGRKKTLGQAINWSGKSLPAHCLWQNYSCMLWGGRRLAFSKPNARLALTCPPVLLGRAGRSRSRTIIGSEASPQEYPRKWSEPQSFPSIPQSFPSILSRLQDCQEKVDKPPELLQPPFCCWKRQPKYHLIYLFFHAWYMPGLPGSPECMWLLTLKFLTNVFRFWRKMGNKNKIGFWFPGCCHLGLVMLDFGSGGVLHNCQLLKCNFLSENNAASSFLIRKRKIKYKWHHPPYTDDKPFCGSFNGKKSYPFFPLSETSSSLETETQQGPSSEDLPASRSCTPKFQSFSYVFWEIFKTYPK